ncbi:hypothetical protein JAAARDRAFT_207415 [Jaapia argillacea MUCL 33604]|uniref:Uncharacterized protein n=1 Tax=Jaapia argillacea MUCL 33604 TaxID=933084 RepID=A0A067PT85_9AGAM|nr:hypothetical protein JAAARDRAFT_207415 [Jaapia argillacea MUCL 33604]
MKKSPFSPSIVYSQQGMAFRARGESLLHVEVIGSGSTDESACDAEVSDLKKQMQTLCVEQTASHCDAMHTDPTIPPIHRLPPELLTEVFLNCLDDEGSPQPFLLYAVCRHWRNVTLGAPRLWSRIYLTPNFPSSERLALIRAHVQILLTRSAGAPLSLHIDFSKCAMASLLDLFLPHAHRFRHVKLSNPTLDDIAPFIRAIANHSPMLESFAIPSYSREDISPKTTLSDIKAFLAPSLREVTLAGCWHPSTLFFPWSHLTHLRLGDVVANTQAQLSFTSCIEILRQCAELTHCWLYIDATDNSLTIPTINNKPIVLPELRFLLLDWSYRDYLLLEQLVAPKLVDFSYGPPYFPEDEKCPFALRAIETCLNQSHCTLESLALDLWLVPFNDIISLLRLLPSLTSLHIDLYYEDDAWTLGEELSHALWGPHTPCEGILLLPILRKLSINTFCLSGSSDFSILEDSFADIIASRCSLPPSEFEEPDTLQPSTSLTHVAITSEAVSAECCEYLRSRLSRHIAAGLQLDLPII